MLFNLIIGLDWIQKDGICIYAIQCILAGFFLGSVWYNLDNGDVQARMSLFAVLYIILNVLVVDSLDGKLCAFFL